MDRGTTTTQLAAGQGVKNAGDVNGDGHEDVIVAGNDSGFGVAYVVYGGAVSSGTIGTVAGATLEGETSGDAAAGSLAAAGDVDGDGFDDVLVGATAYSPAGRAYLVYGPIAGTSSLADARPFDGESAASGFGTVGSAGDLDGDGSPDLVLGAYQDDMAATDAGATYIFYASSL